MAAWCGKPMPHDSTTATSPSPLSGNVMGNRIANCAGLTLLWDAG